MPLADKRRDRLWRGAFGFAVVVALGTVWASAGGQEPEPTAARPREAPAGPPTAEVIERALESALLVQVVACGVDGTATAVAVEGGAVTNAHVVAGSSEVRLVAGGVSYEATVVAFDPLQDLALLEANEMSVPALELAPPRGGDAAVVLARGLNADDEPVVEGVPAEIERTINITISDIYGEGRQQRPGMELTAELGPGDSGSAVIDAQGRLVGIVFSTSVRTEGVAYAVSSVDLKALVDSRSAVGVGVDVGPCR